MLIHYTTEPKNHIIKPSRHNLCGSVVYFTVLGAGLEPARRSGQRFLRPSCLPIPTSKQIIYFQFQRTLNKFNLKNPNCQLFVVLVGLEPTTP